MKSIKNSRSFLPLMSLVSPLFAFPQFAPAQTWTPNGAPNLTWRSVASSADGSKLAAGAVSPGGQIYISTNSGATWMPTCLPITWKSIACSVDGRRLIAVSSYRPIYTSGDGGQTWFTTGLFGSENWVSVACSADGTKAVAAAWFTMKLYTSTDSGTNWTQANVPQTNWMAAGCSSDGSLMLAGANAGPIYASTDGGITWNPTAAPAAGWGSVACSADGSKWVATTYQPSGAVYTSVDSGATWQSNNLPNLNWASAASSSDGTKLFIGASPGPLYTSTNSGSTWQQADVPITNLWFSIASSADGAKVAAATWGGRIYSYEAIPSLAISDSAGSAVLTWPFSATEYVLETSPSPKASAIWTPLTQGMATSGQTFVITNHPDGPAFYRLHKQ